MKKLLHLIVRYRQVSISTVFVDPIITEEWVILNHFKFKRLKHTKKTDCDHSQWLGIN